MTTGELLITVLGGIKITGLDRMRVTLKVEHKARRYCRCVITWTCTTIPIPSSW
jgi:hypothetical protein